MQVLLDFIIFVNYNCNKLFILNLFFRVPGCICFIMDCGHIQPDSEFYVDPDALLQEEKKRKREALNSLRQMEKERSVSNNITSEDKEAMGQKLNNLISEISIRKRQSKPNICSLHSLPGAIATDGNNSNPVNNGNVEVKINKSIENETKTKRQKKVSNIVGLLLFK